MLWLILFHIPSFFHNFWKEFNLRNFKKFGIFGIIQRSIFQMKSEKIFQIYYNTFSKIAKEFHSYIVAGSIFLPKYFLNNI